VAYFEVLRGYKRIYSCSGKQAFSVEIFGTDMTGNGVPNLVIRQWQGSAHGDSRYLILEICDDSIVNEVDVINGRLSVEFRDVNQDGIVEIAGKDKAYSYFGGDCFAGSPLPLVVLSFDKTQAKFVPDRKLMSKHPFSRDQFNTFSLKYRKDTRWSKESRPPSELFVTMLERIYSGNEKQAWELFDASWPDNFEISKEKYKEALKNDSRKSHFYCFIADWDNE
jgi:hypothetical protein